MFAELCTTTRGLELVRIHRFTHPWEAAHLTWLLMRSEMSKGVITG